MLNFGAGARDRSRSPLGQDGGNHHGAIVQLVFAREQARLAKNFVESDSLRDQLSAMGVQLFDKTDSWKSSDGLSGKIPSWTEIESGVGPESFLEQAAVVPLDPNDPYAQVKALVLQREQARAAKDFTGADRIRDELKGYGIEIWDKEKIWKGQDGSCGIVVGYLSKQIADKEITTLVEQREKARQNKDFRLSDVIRDELKVKGINILDKEKIWKANDGRSGPVPGFNDIGAGGGSAGYGTGGVSAGYGSSVVAGSVAAQRPVIGTLKKPSVGMFGGGCAPTMNVSLAGGLPFGGGFQATAPAAQSISMSTAGTTGMAMEAISVCQQAMGRMLENAEVAVLVETRERLRHAKDMSSADSVRTAMKQCGLEVYDKEKTWKTSDGRQGAVPAWSSFA